MKIKIATVFIILCMVYGGGYLSSELHKGDAPAASAELLTIRRVQEIIGCEKIDGKVSPDWRQSETQKKWDAYINDQYGVEACLKAGMR